MALLDSELGSVFHVPVWKGFGRKLKSTFTLLGTENSRGSRSKRPAESAPYLLYCGLKGLIQSLIFELDIDIFLEHVC